MKVDCRVRYLALIGEGGGCKSPCTKFKVCNLPRRLYLLIKLKFGTEEHANSALSRAKFVPVGEMRGVQKPQYQNLVKFVAFAPQDAV